MIEKYPLRGTQLASRVLDGEVIIMSAADSTLFSLNPVASVIWEAADGRTPLSAIVRERICEEFDVDPDTASRDAEAFAEELKSHGILQLLDGPIPAGPQVAEGA